MKAIYAVLFLLFASVAFGQAQQPQRTMFRSHYLGESFTEWATAENVNLGMCEKPKSNVKAACKRLERIQSGEYLDFSTTDDTHTTRTFTFRAAKLEQIDISNWMIGSNYQEQVGFLEQRYGKPSDTKTVTYGNAMGAKWDCGQSSWFMPDGAVIMAVESIENLPTLGPTRKLTVTLLSKDKVQEMATFQKNKPNPY